VVTSGREWNERTNDYTQKKARGRDGKKGGKRKERKIEQKEKEKTAFLTVAAVLLCPPPPSCFVFLFLFFFFLFSVRAQLSMTHSLAGSKLSSFEDLIIITGDILEKQI
jgi:hypothetical protein